MICDNCRDEQYRWMDTKPSQMNPGIRIGNNAMYDMSARGAVENTRRRVDDWYDLVRRQCEMIKESCEREGHVAIPAQENAA